MSDERATLIRYRLERAHEALEEADVCWKMAHYNSYVNRLYYACCSGSSRCTLFFVSTQASCRECPAVAFQKRCAVESATKRYRPVQRADSRRSGMPRRDIPYQR